MFPDSLTQNWTVRKPSAAGKFGLVASQSHSASEVGRAVLEAGGNAADAAVAMAFCLATCEPWNSGLGGIGYCLVRSQGGVAETLDFGPKSPSAAAASMYRLSGDTSGDIFGWPKVEGDRNIHGPLSFCVPSAVAGYGQLHARYGSLPWHDVVMPAVKLAQRGMMIDWFAVTKICQKARILRLYDQAAKIYLPDDLPPTIVEYGKPERLRQGNLSQTLERIATNGWQDFYLGEVAGSLLQDFLDVGAIVSRSDLEACDPRWRPSEHVNWRGAGKLYHPGSFTGAPALVRVIEKMNQARFSKEPDPEWFSALAHALMEAFGTRIDTGKVEGDPLQAVESCTTHLIATDAQGLTVTLTTTLLGLMGSAMVMPRTGVLMNNGMMWFDPRIGSRNGVSGSKRPLSNMLPVIFVGDDGRVIAGGASGGRRILSSVYQMIAYLHDFRMDVEQAAAHPRIDVSNVQTVGVDRRLPPEIASALSAGFPIQVLEHTAAPLNFGCPSFVSIHQGSAAGITDAMTPWSTALAADRCRH